MKPQRALASLKVSQLRHAATCLGLATTGKKADLEDAIHQRIDIVHGFNAVPRIVSIDMGIRNLGICVLEAPDLLNRNERHSPHNTTTRLKVLAWKKLDILNQLSPSSLPAIPEKTTSSKRLRLPIDASVFRPSLLSRIAVSISQDVLATYNPTYILIERQRFRSGGASAVQEWTLRVNMLESMLWCSFATTRSATSTADFPEMEEVNPARVANFWCGPSASIGTRITSSGFDDGFESSAGREGQKFRKKIEKKDKIAVVRTWLANDSDVELDFTPQTQDMADAFAAVTANGRRRSKVGLAGTAGSPSKLDDLADCLLQGVAWVRWEENRRALRGLLRLADTTEHGR